MNDPELIGKTVAGRYRVTEKIGSGGMGAVYAAVQEPLGRKVALKVLKPSFATDDVAIARFKKEAAIVSGLNHPNIVTLHDYGETDDGLLYIVMEYLRGSTLSRVRRGTRQGVLPWRRTIPLMQDVVRALSAAHAAGVIHRDLKLDNIMLVEDHGDRDFVKILDFGVAKTITSEGTAPLTLTDSSPGTPGYMSPELARGITDDPRSDFYALGVVWFELLVGVRPFTDKNAMDVFFAQMTRPAPSIRDVSPHLNLPEAIDALVRRLLDKSPAGRPPDTRAFLEALKVLDESLLGTRGARGDGGGTSSTPPKSDDAPETAEPQTVPTGSAAFLPTQMGSPPPFTDAALTEGDVVPLLTPGSIDTLERTEANMTTAPLPVPLALPSPPAPPAARSDRPSFPYTVLAAAVAVAVTIVSVAIARDSPRDDTPLVDPRVPLAPVFAVEVARRRDKPPSPEVRARSAAVPVAPAAPLAPVVSLEPPPPLAPVTGATSSVSVEPASGREQLSPPPDESTLRRRLASVGDLMRDRMLLRDDVPEYERLSARATDALDGGRPADAVAALTELEANLSSVRFSDAFIRKKLARIEAALPEGWPRDPAQVAELAKLRTDVHERFGARDLPGTNLALNRLWLFALKGKMRTQAR